MKLRVKLPAKSALVRVIAYGLVTGLAALGAFAFIRLSNRPSTLTGVTQARNTSPRDTFDDLYQLGWRSDGQAGNTLVEAVLEYPQLITATQAYADRSPIQSLTLDAVRGEPNASLVPLLISLEHNEELDQWPDLSVNVDLATEARTAYPLDRVLPLATGSGPSKTYQAVVWFRRPTGTPAPRELTLTVRGMPGTTRPTTFTWNLDVLGLVN